MQRDPEKPDRPHGSTWLARRDVPDPRNLLSIGKQITDPLRRPLTSRVIPIPELTPTATSNAVLHAYSGIRADLTAAIVKLNTTRPDDELALGVLAEAIFGTSDQLKLVYQQLLHSHEAIARGLRHDIGNQISAAYSSLINFLYDEPTSRSDHMRLTRLSMNQARTALASWLPILEITSGRHPSYQLTLNRLLHQLTQMRLSDIRQFLPQHGLERIHLSPALPIIFGNLLTNTNNVNSQQAHRGLLVTAANITSDFPHQPRPILNLVYFDQGSGYPDAFFDPQTRRPLVGRTLRPGGTGQGLQIIGTLARSMDAPVRLGNYGSREKGGAYTQIIIPLQPKP